MRWKADEGWACSAKSKVTAMLMVRAKDARLPEYPEQWSEKFLALLEAGVLGCNPAAKSNFEMVLSEPSLNAIEQAFRHLKWYLRTSVPSKLLIRVGEKRESLCIRDNSSFDQGSFRSTLIRVGETLNRLLIKVLSSRWY